MAIQLNKVTRNIKLVQDTRVIKVNRVDRDIKVVSVGRRGPASTVPGPEGDSAYQVWLDAGNTGSVQDFLDSLKGADGTVGSDAHYEMPFTNLAFVQVIHNLHKRPAVTVIDSAGDEVEGAVEHVNNDQVNLTFNSSFTGIAICN